MKKKSYNLLILIGITLLLITLGMKPGCLFGSNTDWFNQHTVFPEYFRNLFYETKQLIPNFAFHIGAGQNIFHFSYYGLLNPIILLSYLFPFIEMTTYIEIANIIMIVLSVILCYVWLKKRGFEEKQVFLATCLFASATPLIFQAHRHFMFVDYMPFLLLGIMGVDRYIEDGYRSQVVISIFLMIMTSYYYSIGGLLVIAIYYIYRYIEKNRFSLGKFIKDGLCFLYPYLLGILLACVLLLPTFYVVLHGRSESEVSISFLKLFLPKLDFQTFLYDSYGLGLTVISLLALVFGIFSHKKEHRFLSIACVSVSIIPIFMYFLNGTLYIRSKVLIPFLPLFILLTTYFLEKIESNKIKHNFLFYLPWCLILGTISIFLSSHSWTINIVFLLDLVLTIILLTLYQKQHKKGWLYAIVLIAFTASIVSNQSEGYVAKEKHQQVNDPVYEKTVEKLSQLDESFYRMKQLQFNLPILNKVYGMHYYQTSLYSSTQNTYYHDFFRSYLGNAISNRNNLMNSSSSNLLFDTYMGIKYIFGGEESIGYEKVEGLEEVYQNTNAYPVMYARSSLLSKEEFEKVAYPYQTDLLLRNVIIDHKVENQDISKIKEVSLDYQITNQKHLNIKKTKDGYLLDLKEDATLELDFKEDLTNQILLLDFFVENEVSCEEGDRAITINGKTNKITCEDWLYANENNHFQYVIGEKGSNNHLLITIDKGLYEIKDIKTYLLDYQEIESLKNNIDPFIFDIKETKGDHIYGNISVTQDGYFVTSIPYDPGFEITVDGNRVDYELVNQAFIGFPIEKGEHTIEIVYQAPWLKEGKILSFAGCVLFVITIGFDFHRYGKRRKYGKLKVDKIGGLI